MILPCLNKDFTLHYIRKRVQEILASNLLRASRSEHTLESIFCTTEKEQSLKEGIAKVAYLDYFG